MKHKYRCLNLAIAFMSMLAFGLGLIHQETTPVQAKAKKAVTIYLTRHGETTGNVMNRVQGFSDFPLTKNGLEVANDLGRGLKGITFKRAYSGDLTRQEVTARRALKYSGNQKVKIRTNKKLREGGYGSFEGDAIATDSPKLAAVYGYQSGDEFMEKTGGDYWTMLQDAYYKLDRKNSEQTELATKDRAENAATVQKRMDTMLKKIAKATKKQGGGNVLVVSSGMSINEYLASLKTDKYTGAPLKNASVTRLVYKNGKFKIRGKIGSLHYVNKGAKDTK